MKHEKELRALKPMRFALTSEKLTSLAKRTIRDPNTLDIVVNPLEYINSPVMVMGNVFPNIVRGIEEITRLFALRAN